MTSISEQLIRDRFAQAALSANYKGRRLQQPELSECAVYLWTMDDKRQTEKGKPPMNDDHLKQEAVAWMRRIYG